MENLDPKDVEKNENQEQEVVENQQVDTKVYSEEEVEAIKKQIHEDNQKAWDKRWGREKSKMEEKYSKQMELANLLQQQTNAANIDDLLKMSYEQYGVERPNISNSRDEEILGKADAREILDLNDYKAIEDEANRLAEISNRNAREEAMFMELGKHLTENKKKQARKKEFESLGIAEKDLLENENFKAYMSKFRDETPLKEIYDNYKLTQPKKEKPFVEGSVKDNGTISNEVKDFYTYEEASKFTKKDFDKNPKLFQSVQKSMEKWSKK